jgi:hypothetical protein
VSVLGTVGQTVLGCPRGFGILTTDPIASRTPMASQAVARLFQYWGPAAKRAPAAFLESAKGRPAPMPGGPIRFKPRHLHQQPAKVGLTSDFPKPSAPGSPLGQFDSGRVPGWKIGCSGRIFREWRQLSNAIAVPSTNALKISSWHRIRVARSARSAELRWRRGGKASTFPHSNLLNVQTESRND